MFPVLDSRSLLVICFIYSSVYTNNDFLSPSITEGNMTKINKGIRR